MNETNNDTLFCDLESFQNEYRPIHAYLSLIVCIFGSITNILNIRILMIKEMRTSTNLILTGLAVSDLLVMLEYIPFSIHSYLNVKARFYPEHFSYSWAVYMYFHAGFTLVLHFISCCLAVLLAIWRYIAISLPQKNIQWCNVQRTKLAIFLSYSLCPLICLPICLGLTIKPFTRNLYPNGTFIALKDQDKYGNITNVINATLYTAAFRDKFSPMMFLVYSVILKLLPCILLTGLSIALIHGVLLAKKRWKNLSNNAGIPLVKSAAKQEKIVEKEQQADRTTRMLLAVLLLFLLTEFPQAIIGLLSLIFGHHFHINCYQRLGDLFDIIALTNSAINFILYCSMSQQFRAEFHRLFKSHFCYRCLHKKRIKSKEAFTDTTEL